MRTALHPALLLALLCASCWQPRIASTERDYRAGMALRKHDPTAAQTRLRSAIERARALIAAQPTPAEYLEAHAVIARASLELGRPSDAEIAIEEGRLFFENHDPNLTWRGDALAIHVMKGNFFAGRAREIMRAFGGSTSDSKEADRVGGEYDKAVIEYMQAEDKGEGAVRSFVRLRLVQALLDKAKIMKVRAAMNDQVYLAAAKKALDSAHKLLKQETEAPNPYYDQLLILRRSVEDQLATIKQLMK